MKRSPSLAAGLGLLILASFGLGACSRHAPEAPSVAIDQASLCQVDDYRVATACRPGQKIVFLPARFGNEQLPVMFAALNCDLRYNVALTQGAVTCIFGPITPSQPAAAPSAPASRAQD
jgi:hypothetical protein